MVLAINIGNTNIRMLNGDELILPCADVHSTEDFQQFLEKWYNPGVWGRIEGSIVCSVVPGKTDLVIDGVWRKTGLRPRRVNVEKCGVELKYNSRPGEDRIVCCAAALMKYKPPIIVIDLGTATTISVIDRDGAFIGGSILSGVQMGLNALSRGAALLPLAQISASAPVIGRDTGENLASGAVIGTACAAEGFVYRAERELGKASVVVTGGHASAILPHLPSDFRHEPRLLLDGLLELYARADKAKEVVL